MSNRNYNTEDPYSGFNPFTEPVAPTVSTSSPRPVFSPAILPEAPKSKANENEVVSSEIKKQEKALAALENKIKKQEEEKVFNRKEEPIETGQMNNFPPWPRCFPCKPCFYQDFNVDIVDEYRNIVRLGFYIWISYSLVLFLNLFGTMAYMIALGVTNDTGTNFGVSILMLLLMPPLVYILCFRPIYRGFRSLSSINFFMFFLFFTVVIIILIIQSLGINTLGSCGWMNSLAMDGKYLGVKIFMILITCGFTCLTVLSIVFLVKVNVTYRSTGASFDKAKSEMRNQTISAALHA